MKRPDDQQVLGLLTGDQTILDVARDVTRILRETGLDGAIIGGIAVFLHGHRRTTADVDVLVPDTGAFAKALEANGYQFDRERRQFTLNDVPVHLVTERDIGEGPRDTTIIDDVIVLSLPSLISMKLRSGLNEMLRAQDLADAIAIIRVHKLRSEFARHLPSDLRSEFRTLVRAIESERAQD